jgi:hypothetical protein
MTLFKNKNTWLWVIVVIVLLLLVFGMKKCENMPDCQTCGGCSCPSCISHNEIMDSAYKQNVESFVNTKLIDSQVNTMHDEMSHMDSQLLNMNKEMSKMNKQMQEMSTELNKKKSLTPTLTGHTDNIYHMTASPVITHRINDDKYEDDNMLSMPMHHNMPHVPSTPMHYNMPMHHNMPFNHNMRDLHEKVRELMEKMPKILNKCTPDLLQTIGTIAKLIESTDGKVHKLKSVEPTLTKEFKNLNEILECVDKSNLTCLETETRLPLSKMVCSNFDRMPVHELREHVENLEYVNEMFKSQRNNFRKLRDLFVVRMRDLVNSCDTRDPVKRDLQLRLISVMSHILHNLGYIFQDDTIAKQQKML